MRLHSLPSQPRSDHDGIFLTRSFLDGPFPSSLRARSAVKVRQTTEMCTEVQSMTLMKNILRLRYEPFRPQDQVTGSQGEPRNRRNELLGRKWSIRRHRAPLPASPRLLCLCRVRQFRNVTGVLHVQVLRPIRWRSGDGSERHVKRRRADPTSLD
jgi:hypothetical protein